MNKIICPNCGREGMPDFCACHPFCGDFCQGQFKGKKEIKDKIISILKKHGISIGEDIYQSSKASEEVYEIVSEIFDLVEKEMEGCADEDE